MEAPRPAPEPAQHDRGQSRGHSAAEAACSTAVGFAVSWAATPFILAGFGYQAGVGTAFGITAVYTALSVVRGYAVRRIFNRWHRRSAQ